MNDARATYVDLLRHGAAQGNGGYIGHTDPPLSEAGAAQMWAAVDGSAIWSRVVTSPLRRCATFAQAVAERYAIPLEVDLRLREIDFGRWEGKTSEELMRAEPEALARFWREPSRYGPPEGESLESLHERVLAAWFEIVADGSSALIVAHGGPIRVILCHERRLPIDALLTIDVPLGTLHRIALKTTIATAETAKS